MPLRNTKNNYGVINKAFHWILALLIFGMLGLGLYMVGLPKNPDRAPFYVFHKATGTVILLLVTLRLLWRWSTVTPILETIPRYQRVGAHITHVTLYVLMFAAPISGMLMSLLGGHSISFYGWFTIPAFTKNPEVAHLSHIIHEGLVYFWVLLLALHIAAALYHHFIRKDDVLKRMV